VITPRLFGKLGVSETRAVADAAQRFRRFLSSS
jgi:hypothetical protein